MTAKKVCAVIAIVLGILFFLNGLETYFVADFLGNEMKYKSKSSYARKEVQSSKAVAMIGSLLGIGMSIGGTMLLKQDKKQQVTRKGS